MGFMRPKPPKGPSPDETKRREESARQAEKERLARQQAEEEAAAQVEKEKRLAAEEGKRKAFAGKLLTAEEEAQDGSRKRFLKGT